MDPTAENPRSTYLEILVLVTWLVGAKGVEHFFESLQPGEFKFKVCQCYKDKQLIHAVLGGLGGVLAVLAFKQHVAKTVMHQHPALESMGSPWLHPGQWSGTNDGSKFWSTSFVYFRWSLLGQDEGSGTWFFRCLFWKRLSLGLNPLTFGINGINVFFFWFQLKDKNTKLPTHAMCFK